MNSTMASTIQTLIVQILSTVGSASAAATAPAPPTTTTTTTTTA